jgi:hypothetical protein
MILVLQLQTYASRLSLPKIFLITQIPKTILECKKCSNWNKCKETIEAEVNSHKKRKVFIDVIPTPPRTFPVGFK